MKTILSDGLEVTINFDKDAMIKEINAMEPEEGKVEIGNRWDDGYVSEEDQTEMFKDAASIVAALTLDDITKLINTSNFARKKNGTLKKGSYTEIHRIDVADYVTDFTNAWYYDAIEMKVIDDKEISIRIQRRQMTH